MVLPVELLDTLVEPVLVFEPAGRLRHANRAAMRRMPVEPGMALAIRFHDGPIAAVATGKDEAPPGGAPAAKPRKPRAAKTPPTQESLF